MFDLHVRRALANVSNHPSPSTVTCVASVSVRSMSKERGTRVKDRAENVASERAGQGVGRKGRKCLQTNPGISKSLSHEV